VKRKTPTAATITRVNPLFEKTMTKRKTPETSIKAFGRVAPRRPVSAKTSAGVATEIDASVLDRAGVAEHGAVSASTTIISDDERLESLAREIERLHIKASLQIAERLAKAHGIFRYRRDEGGFAGWVENRLKLSSSTAYRLLDVHERFGGGESLSIWETLPISAVYLLAARSTPDKAVQEIAERVKVGEQISYAEAKKTIGRARRQENGAKSDKAGGDVVDDTAESAERRKAQFAAMDSAPSDSNADADPENTASGMNGAPASSAPSENEASAANASNNKTTSDAAANAAAYLAAAWKVAPPEVQSAHIHQLGCAVLYALMSDTLKAKFRDHLLSQAIATASKSASFAVHSTDQLHVALRCADQKESSEEDIEMMSTALRCILDDAARKNIARADIVIAVGRPEGDQE
jgi:hypothetical protein